MGMHNAPHTKPGGSSPEKGWTLVWSDEFDNDGPPNPKNWNYERGFVRNSELQWYQPENARCIDGKLIIEGRKEVRRNPDYVRGSTNWKTNRAWIPYTSSSITTQGLQEFTYGRFEARARIDPRSGSWPTFWTLGADIDLIHWPACGEIDIMESYAGTVLANVIHGRKGETIWSIAKKPITELGGEAWAREFHVWTMEWDAQKIDLRLDGELMNHFDIASTDDADCGNPFHKPVYILLNLAMGQNGGDPSKSDLPLRFEVDWVRVYQRNELSA